MEELEMLTDLESLYQQKITPYYAREREPKLFALLSLQYGKAPRFQITSNRHELKIPDFNKNKNLRGELLYAELPAKGNTAKHYKTMFTNETKHQSSPLLVKKWFQEQFNYNK